MTYKGEIFHIYAILEAFDSPQPQIKACMHAHLSNYQINGYLLSLYKLGYIDIASKDDITGRFTRKAKYWKTTAKGYELKTTLEDLAKL